MLITYNYIVDKIYYPVLNRINIYFVYLKKFFFNQENSKKSEIESNILFDLYQKTLSRQNQQLLLQSQIKSECENWKLINEQIEDKITKQNFSIKLIESKLNNLELKFNNNNFENKVFTIENSILELTNKTNLYILLLCLFCFLFIVLILINYYYLSIHNTKKKYKKKF